MDRKVIQRTLIAKFGEDGKKYEKEIYVLCERLYPDNFEEKYNDLAYEKVGQLFKNVEAALQDMKNDKIGKEAFCYTEIRENKEKEIDKIINPPKVEKGSFQCKKCKSKETWFYQMQTRSADEPITNFVTCISCGHQWRC